MPIDYFANREWTTPEKLDKAWKDYQDTALSKSQRVKSLEFMVYVFDVRNMSKQPNALNRLLEGLMNQRERMKSRFPNYIPSLNTGYYNLDSLHKMTPTKQSKATEDAVIQHAFDSQDLLDVNQDDKEGDESCNTRLLTPKERAHYNLEISHGCFYQYGKLYDSEHSIAHAKPGFVAFTLNSNGELSVFAHRSGQSPDDEKLFHTSMNAGVPVLAAGEMEIRNGKLISINTHSGHYDPSLYTMARFLEYLSHRGIDIRDAIIYTRYTLPKEIGIEFKKTFLKGDIDPWYAVKASDIVHSIKAIIKNNVDTTEQYLKKRSKKLHNPLGTEKSKAKERLAKEFIEELTYIHEKMKDASSLFEIKSSLEILDSVVSRYESQIHVIGAQNTGFATLFGNMKQEIKAYKEKYNISREADEKRIATFKKIY